MVLYFRLFQALNSPMISARARIGIQNANLEYSGKITLICFGPQIKIIGTVTDISLDIDLQVEKNLVVNVHKFGVSKNGDLKLEFRNLETFDYLSDKVNIHNFRIMPSYEFVYVEKGRYL